MAAKTKKSESKSDGKKAKKPAHVVAKHPDVTEEALFWNQGSSFVFGVDEAGRGCLAGPVSAAVSCWAPFSRAFGFPADVRDSKLMTEIQREDAFAPVMAHALAYGVAYASPAEIDRWNILRATHLAIARALEQALCSLAARSLLKGSSYKDFAFLIDGNQPMVSQAGFFVRMKEFEPEFPYLRALFKRELVEKCLVKGDSKVFSIASASVLAKVSRDRLMVELDQRYPAYEFGLHKGYSTPRHIENLRKHGPCSEHRKSFSPVNEALSLFP